jgi:hypothetical protein
MQSFRIIALPLCVIAACAVAPAATDLAYVPGSGA